MKNNFFLFLFLFVFLKPLFAENLNIQSSTISIDKETKLTIFKNEVTATDDKNNIFQAEYAEFDKDVV